MNEQPKSLFNANEYDKISFECYSVLGSTSNILEISRRTGHTRNFVRMIEKKHNELK